MSTRTQQPSKIARHKSFATPSKDKSNNVLAEDTVEETADTAKPGLKRKAEALETSKPVAKPTTTTTSRVGKPGRGAATVGAGSRRGGATSGIRRAPTAATATARGGSKVAARSIPVKKAPTTTSSSAINGTARSLAKENKDPARVARSAGTGPLAKKKRLVAPTAKGSTVKSHLEEMKDKSEALKTQIQSSTDSVDQMNEKIESSEAKIKELESSRANLQKRMTAKENENNTIAAQLSDMQQKLEEEALEHEQTVKALDAKHKLELAELKKIQESIQQAHDSLADELRQTEERLTQEKQENAKLKSTISSQSAAFLTLEGDHSALKTKLQRTEDTLKTRESTIEQLQSDVKDNKQLIAELEQKIREEEMMRRRLHNTIQELKGNIRVFCRVRPLLNDECNSNKLTEGSMPHMKLPTAMGGKDIELCQTQESADGSKSVTKSYPFSFDNVFPINVEQERVFEEISQLVQSALDGYPVCIFAYGQTGSGKTYTMEGPNHPDATSIGMIPRAVHQIFATAEKLKEKGWAYTMEGQFVEIYNETIHDLLGSGDLNKKHDIKHVAGNKTIITDVKTVMLDTSEKVTALLKKASQNRAVGSTLCNERSSRSHSVFTLRLTGRNVITDETSEGVLNLIDLAGSERLAMSGATGDRLKETQAINKSLASLGDVIAALSNNKDGHIPYRNSKLTYLLQNSLGGNSKTLMFVNISPLPESFQETLCSLRFATKVNACHIGTARRVAK